MKAMYCTDNVPNAPRLHRVYLIRTGFYSQSFETDDHRSVFYKSKLRKLLKMVSPINGYTGIVPVEVSSYQLRASIIIMMQHGR